MEETSMIERITVQERTGATNREAGEVFGGLSKSAIGKIYQSFKKKLMETGNSGEMLRQLKENCLLPVPLLDPFAFFKKLFYEYFML